MTEERRPRTHIGLEPAFPNDADPSAFGFSFGLGLNKREHFASLILAGMNANPDPQFRELTHVEMVERSIEQADLLVEALVKADREDA
jgi:hypothetical protein